LKQFFRRLLFTALLGSAVVVIMALYGQLFAGQVRELEVSPDQNKIAEWRMYGKTSATTSPFSAIELRTRMNPFRHTILSGVDYGAELSVSWLDACKK
jgi:hypothetical protein